MPVKIEHHFKKSPRLLDVPERKAFLKQIGQTEPDEMIDTELHANLALKDLRTKLNYRTKKLNPAIKNSAAFVALEENLFEYIKNSLDAKAQTITITICDRIQNGNVTIQCHDDGQPFKPSMLTENNSNSYEDIIKNATHFSSSKDAERRKGQTHLVGGCGVGLKFTADFLKRNTGILMIGKQVKLTLISIPHAGDLDLRKAFRKERDEVLDKLASQSDAQYDNGTVINLSETDDDLSPTPESSHQTITRSLAKHPALGLKLEITDQLRGRFNPVTSALTSTTPSSLFDGTQKPSASTASTPVFSPLPMLKTLS